MKNALNFSLTFAVIFTTFTASCLHAHDEPADNAPSVTYLDSTSRSIRLRPTLNDVDIAYKVQLSPIRAVQLGIGMEAYYYEKNEEFIFDNPENKSEYTDIRKTLSLILSAQYLLYKRIEPNYYLFWGPGISAHIRPTTRYEDQTYNYFYLRLNATAGFEWFISKRLSFIGETRFYFTYSERYSEFDNSNNIQKSTSVSYYFGYYITRLSMAFYIR